MFRGEVAAIFVAPAAGAPMASRDEVEAIAGRGLAGDRYLDARGTYSGRRLPDAQRAVTLIEREAVAAAREECGIEECETRRNVVTVGVPLNHLVGRTFLVGPVRLRGINLSEPCAYLEGITHPAVRARARAPGRAARRDPRRGLHPPRGHDRSGLSPGRTPSRSVRA